MTNPLATFIGWSVVPNVATSVVQTVWYGITIRAGDPKPQAGSQLYAKHYRRIRIALIAAYLFYTFYEAGVLMQRRGDFYQLLGVPLDVDERALKSRFRRLAALHHPDKVSSVGGISAQDYYVELKLAQETLSREVQRFAYDRFGPDMLLWQQHCTTRRDFLAAGLQAHAPTYIASAVIMMILGAMGYLEWGRFWRYYLTALLVVLEVYTITRPESPWLLSSIVNPVLTSVSSHPPLLQFQFLELARNFMFTTFMGLSQLGPMLQGPGSHQSANEVAPAQLAQLEQIARAGDNELDKMLIQAVAPYPKTDGQSEGLEFSIREWLVQSTIREHAPVKKAIHAAMARRRREAQTEESADVQTTEI